MERFHQWIEQNLLCWRDPFDSQTFTLTKLRSLSSDGLEHLLRSERQGATYGYWGEAALRELDRRNSVRQGLVSWAAITISILALLVSVVQCAKE